MKTWYGVVVTRERVAECGLNAAKGLLIFAPGHRTAGSVLGGDFERSYPDLESAQRRASQLCVEYPTESVVIVKAVSVARPPVAVFEEVEA